VSPLWLRLQAEVEGPLALLRVATSVNAELLGRDDLGRIRSGAVADLLVLDGDRPSSCRGSSGSIRHYRSIGHRQNVYHCRAVCREAIDPKR
jgi:cytosine/adenosine deaminase-related metal-dependent hydrolase